MTADATPADAAWTSSTAGSIEEDLSHLWVTAARQSPVSRALMSNLVIVAGGEASAGDAEHEAEHVLGEVARRHPARVVLLNHRCTSRPEAPQSVRVRLFTVGPAEHRYGIEIISIAVACLDRSLPSILRAVTRGDVPTTLWLSGDLSAATPARPLVDISRQMVYDSGKWKDLSRGFQGVAGLLDDSHPPALVDLAWRRLAPLRRAVATALEPLPFDDRPRPEQLTITAGPGRAGDAWLLWGWLQTGLRWPSGTRRAIARGEGDTLELRFHGQNWSADVSQWSVAGRDDGAGAIVARDTAGRTVTVSPAQESVAEALSDELTRLSHDTTLERIVRSLAN